MLKLETFEESILFQFLKKIKFLPLNNTEMKFER